MSAGKYTPGPWGFREPNGKGMGFEIRETGAWFGARTCDPETAANVRLCAAAPDLLEALIDLRWHTQNMDMDDEESVKAAEVSMGKARAAIAKARGEA